MAEKANIRKETIWSIDFQNLAPVTITNYENNTNNTLTGNIFDILDESQQVIKQGLVTNQDGKIETLLEEGKYFIRQTHVADKYSLASNLIGFEITNTQNVDLKVYNSEIVEKETTNEKTEVNITEETEKITENTVTNVTNFHTKNIEKEVVEKTNEINLESINYFVNTIHRKNINNITKENVYNNEAWEETIQSKVLPGVKRFTKFSTEKFIQDMNNIKSDKLEVPNLPIASRK